MTMRIAHCNVCSLHANAKAISRRSIINGRMQEMNNRKIAMLHVPCGTCVSATTTIKPCMYILMEGREETKGIKIEKKSRIIMHEQRTVSTILEYHKLKQFKSNGNQAASL